VAPDHADGIARGVCAPDIGAVKAEAGRRLLAGETLPIEPGPESTPSAEPEEYVNIDAFFTAGYTYEDAPSDKPQPGPATPQA
jgi:hypothetical protein